MSENKDVFMSKYWVEERHDFLKALPLKEQKELVDSLSPDDIDENVNWRRFQEQYICDYIDYLWEISKGSFWKHIATSLKNPEGLIPGENDFTITIIKTERMPKYVFRQLLKALERLVQNSSGLIDSYFCEMHAEIVCSKLSNPREFERLKTIVLDWFDNLAIKERELILDLFSKFVSLNLLASLGFKQ